MNERIQELYEQSLTREMVKDHAGNPMMAIKQNPEKFAELIVRECIAVINQPNGVGDDDVIRISSDVKKHFGVEE